MQPYVALLQWMRKFESSIVDPRREFDSELRSESSVVGNGGVDCASGVVANVYVTLEFL